jgi:hypothetical protein
MHRELELLKEAMRELSCVQIPLISNENSLLKQQNDELKKQNDELKQ